MKNIPTKVKHWLIHKLGGNVLDLPPIEFKHYNFHPLILQSEYKISTHEYSVSCAQEELFFAQAKRTIASKLVEELIKNDLIKVEHTFDVYKWEHVFRGRLHLVSPEDIERGVYLP